MRTKPCIAIASAIIVASFIASVVILVIWGNSRGSACSSTDAIGGAHAMVTSLQSGGSFPAWLSDVLHSPHPRQKYQNGAGSGSGLTYIREASKRYHDYKVAVADGYTCEPHCVPGMGYHCVNFNLLIEATFIGVDYAKPPLLIYGDAAYTQLIAVEYMVLIFTEEETKTPQLSFPDPNIPLVDFDGPMLHDPIPYPHFDLHAWAWLPNLDGNYAPHNPRIVCPSPHA